MFFILPLLLFVLTWECKNVFNSKKLYWRRVDEEHVEEEKGKS